MVERISADLCVIGAGAAGLGVAAGAAMLGVKTVLIERSAMGGDCLNHGCVPSKALLAAGKAAEAHRGNAALGIAPHEPEIDFPAVMAHIRRVIAAIAPNDSVERFAGLGVRILREEARFVSPEELQAGPWRVRARRFVLATGSRPAIPPIPGLPAVPYLTNETLFQLAQRPKHLIIVGGGPIGIEMAQGFRRLGSAVTVIESAEPLAKEDPELAQPVLDRLRAEGVALRARAQILGVGPDPSGVSVQFENGALTGSHLLIATGRRPVIEGIGLDTAGIAFTPKGIGVDTALRTSNPKVYAIGDALGGPYFTHLAGFHAGLIIRHALFRLPIHADAEALPRVTYCDPELAQVGLTEAEAQARHPRLRIIREPFRHNDRAIAEGEAEGLLKLVLAENGRLLGAGIAGPGAGDLLMPWTLALGRKLSLSALASQIVPYPTRGEIVKRAAGELYRGAVFGPAARLAVSLLKRLP
jgi:pyruvate/2-oxoglutarate dehydrogenase complex dihydrolipoamide dehydrogenase (E3) component